jgi:hypothetical protein
MISRTWAMPNSTTFDCKPIGVFVAKWMHAAGPVSVDPFARNSRLCVYTNDLNPATNARCHMKAEDFLNKLADDGVQADVILLDPPYSPRQITECYSAAGITATMKDTQSSFYTNVRKAALRCCKPGAIVLSFGWNSTGMGKAFETLEILLVAHGGAHNDTICVAQRAPKGS